MNSQELSAWMDRMGYDKRRAAQELGVTVRALEYYLAGTRGISETVERLCKCLEERENEQAYRND